MPYTDPEVTRRKNRESYQRRREIILAQKKEKQKDPAFQEKRRDYLQKETTKERRRARDRALYKNDTSYREAKKARTAAQRSTPEGAARNRMHARAWREANPERFRANIEKWRSENSEYLRSYYRLYKRKRFAEDPAFKVVEYMRRRVRHALHNQNTTKDGTTMALVGCCVAELVAHLEQQFQPGMTWENYGEWHVDHIRELCDFDLTHPEEQAEAFHYSNLRPLWASDNQSRPNKKGPK